MRRPETRTPRDHDALHSDSPAGPAGAVELADVLPQHLLSGGEIVIFAIKPSLWFIPLVSARWIGAMVLLGLAARWLPWTSMTLPLMKLAVGLGLLRLAWATMQWSTRLYVLTNRRVMRIRGVFTVQIFECQLGRIQNTAITLSMTERVLRVGTILISTAAGVEGGGSASWKIVARPVEIHEQLRAAIDRARNRGNHAV
ncbi:MAG: PH domain-containing protein [Phycisphaerae bacterium]|nr:PH domain-containing protein [Phycisphaerae bacterium]